MLHGVILAVSAIASNKSTGTTVRTTSASQETLYRVFHFLVMQTNTWVLRWRRDEKTRTQKV